MGDQDEKVFCTGNFCVQSNRGFNAMNFCWELLYLKAFVPGAFGSGVVLWTFVNVGVVLGGFCNGEGLLSAAYICSLLITILTEGEAIPFTVRLGLKAPSIRSIWWTRKALEIMLHVACSRPKILFLAPVL